MEYIIYTRIRAKSTSFSHLSAIVSHFRGQSLARRIRSSGENPCGRGNRLRLHDSVCFPPFSAFFPLFCCFRLAIFWNTAILFSRSYSIVARWCNGSTSDSGSFSLGSSPGRAAIFWALFFEFAKIRAFFFASDSVGGCFQSFATNSTVLLLLEW